MILTCGVGVGCCYCCTESESVPLYTFSDRVCCGVCTALDLCVACRLFRRAVAVQHVQARMGPNRQHRGQRCWSHRTIRSRHDLRRGEPVAAWWSAWRSRRSVAVQHPHTRMGVSPRHPKALRYPRQRSCPQPKIHSRYDLRRAGPVDVWWRIWFFR
jgi:hypothetical protein